MTLSLQSPVSVRTLVRLAGLVMVVVGLFGMSGLASHATDGATVTDMSMGSLASDPSTTTSSVARSLVETTTAAATAAVTTGRAVVTSAAGHAGMGMNMACLCIAILMLGATGLFGLLNRFPRVTARWSAPRPVVSLRASGREPAPPSLTALSVRRC